MKHSEMTNEGWLPSGAEPTDPDANKIFKQIDSVIKRVVKTAVAKDPSAVARIAAGKAGKAEPSADRSSSGPALRGLDLNPRVIPDLKTALDKAITGAALTPAEEAAIEALKKRHLP